MNIIIQSSINTLKKSINLLSSLSNEDLSNHSVSPYYSCIGSHVRHILDFYDCIFEGIESKYIDLANRKRDERMHIDCDYTLYHVERIINLIEKLENNSFTQSYVVSDDLGLGKTEINYSLGAVLAQANSHAIHHYAIIGYILDRLEIPIMDENFGYNPTTPKFEAN